MLLLAHGVHRWWMRPYVRFLLWLARFRTPYRIAMFVGGYALVNLLLRMEPLLGTILVVFWAAVLYLVGCHLALERAVRRMLHVHRGSGAR